LLPSTCRSTIQALGGWLHGVIMSVNNRIADSWRPKVRTIGIILVIAFSGPIVGLLLSAFSLVLAPPWTFLTGLIYVLIPCLGFPVGIVAVLVGWIRIRGLLVALAVAGVGVIFYLTILGNWVPSGMTNCQSIAASVSQVRYSCVSTSSDDPSYRYEFILEGWSGWPVMRLTHPN
jgi:hypothetical protein